MKKKFLGKFDHKKSWRTALILMSLFAFVELTGGQVQSNKAHELHLSPETIHWGYFDASIEPVLYISSGDTVYVETMVARGLERLRLAGIRDEEIPASIQIVEQGVIDRGPGSHPMTGPIYVNGAEPGDVLEVRILEIDPMVPYGVSGFLPGGGTLPGRFPYGHLALVRFSPDGQTAEIADGVRVPLKPFFGTIGVAPPLLSGRISSGPPGAHAGNLDLKELGVGSTLYLPVHVPGGLLSIGDGHALQGDGEVSGTAAETFLSGTVEVILHKHHESNGFYRSRWPRAETLSHYIAIGLHSDLDEAARLATNEMVEFLVTEKNLSPEDAYVVCSLAVDLRVTQLVDGTKGIHAMIAKSIFK